MSGRTSAAATLTALAGVFALVGLLRADAGWYAAAALLLFAAGSVLVLGPTPDQRGARRRSREPRYFHARPVRR